MSMMRTFGRGYACSSRPQTTGAYHYVIIAGQFVKAGRVCLALVVGTTLFVGLVEDVEIIVSNVIADNDISNEFQD